MYMLISHQWLTSKTLFSTKKKLNVDFMRMHDHRAAHLTYDKAKC